MPQAEYIWYHEIIKFCVYLCKLQLHKPIQCTVSSMIEEVCC